MCNTRLPKANYEETTKPKRTLTSTEALKEPIPGCRVMKAVENNEKRKGSRSIWSVKAQKYKSIVSTKMDHQMNFEPFPMGQQV